MKMTIEKMAEKYGTVDYEGKHYVLTEQAYLTNGAIQDIYYFAHAICPDDGVDEYGLYPEYSVTWYPCQEWLDGKLDDEGEACDWDDPYDVEETGAGYDLEDGRTI